VKFISIKLPIDRDFLFEPSKHDTLIVSTYIVNYSINRIVVRNNINLPVIINRYIKLKRVVEYKTINYF